MTDELAKALKEDRVIDITTTGRQTGKPRRIEMWFHNLDGRLFITGTPGPRDWYANLVAYPEFTFHLKKNVRADLLARATPVVDYAQRQDIMAKIHRALGGDYNLEDWISGSPLVEVELRPQ